MRKGLAWLSCGRCISVKKGIATLLALLFIIAVIFAAYLYINPAGALSGYTTVYVKVTDPSIAPLGTQSINISYSGLQLQVRNSSGTSWINTGSNGTINLIALRNQSQTLSEASLPAGTVPNAARFNITSGTIVINGTQYILTIPKHGINFTLSGKAGSSRALSALLGISSSVSTSFADNSSTFFLSAFPTAILLPESQNSYVGLHQALSATEKSALESQKPSIRILSSSVEQQGNASVISATVEDNSSAPVTLYLLSLSGNESVKISSISPSAEVPPSFGHVTDSLLINETFNAINSAFGYLINNQTTNLTGLAVSKLSSGNLTKLPGFAASTVSKIASQLNLSGSQINQISTNLNSSQSQSLINGLLSNLSASVNSISINGSSSASLESSLEKGISSGKINASSLSNIRSLISNAKKEAAANYPKNLARIQSQFHYVSFFVEENSSLLPTISMQSITSGQQLGYLLQPGKTATLSYKGSLSAGNGIVSISLINGNSYKINVIGTGGAYASNEISAG